MRISVTDQHIASGKPKSITHCPIALAFTEHFGKQALVTNKEVYILSLNKHFVLKGLSLHNLHAFDRGQKIYPWICEAEEQLLPFQIIRGCADNNEFMLVGDGKEKRKKLERIEDMLFYIDQLEAQLEYLRSQNVN